MELFPCDFSVFNKLFVSKNFWGITLFCATKADLGQLTIFANNRSIIFSCYIHFAIILAHAMTRVEGKLVRGA